MASKQLGKLRQWGREVIASKEKTVLTREFKEVEQDVELRRAGVARLHQACGEYYGYLQKKKEYTSVEEGVTMLAVDALGAVMMAHGQEFGEDSAFGQGLLTLGRAHCKIATIQETFALTFRDTYLASLEMSLKDFEHYASQRKKLDSRRQLAYDAAVTKASKAKKEKEVREAEEEVTKAKLRYEETSTDVQSRMHAIQENELQQLRDLTKLLAAETRFAEMYLEALQSTQNEWLDESAIHPAEAPRRKASPHAFAFGRSTPSISSTAKTAAAARPSSVSAATSPSEDMDAADFGFTVKRRGSSAGTPRPSSRGSATSVGTAHSSKRNRNSGGGSDAAGSMSKRLNVAGWASSAVSSLSGSGRSKKEARKDKGTSKERDKGVGRAFSSLEDSGDESEEDRYRYEDDLIGEEGSPRPFDASVLNRVLGQTPSRQLANATNSASSSSSFNSVSASGSSGRPSAAAPRRVLVRAMVDFSGSPGELSFRAGDAIVVLSEPQSGWCMGEVSGSGGGGRRGLFPVNCCCAVEEASGGGARVPSAPPRLPLRMTGIAQRAQEDVGSEDGASVVSVDDGDDGDDEYVVGGRQQGGVVLYVDEPFGDHHLAKSPMVAEHEHEQHEHGVVGDGGAVEEEEMRGLFGAQEEEEEEEGQTSSLFRATTAGSERQGIEVGNMAGNGVAAGNGGGGGNGNGGGGSAARLPPALPQRKHSVKKPPPPPPPLTPARRSTVSGGASISAPSSTANLAAAAASSSGSGSGSGSAAAAAASFFPPPPAGRRRVASRARSSASITQIPQPPSSSMSDTVSPFDN